MRKRSMPATLRVTVTLPIELIEAIDRISQNRGRFIEDAVVRELARRRREQLRRSLAQPHPETVTFADDGLEAWAASLPGDEADLLDPTAGTPVRWVDGRGWVEDAP